MRYLYLAVLAGLLGLTGCAPSLTVAERDIVQLKTLTDVQLCATARSLEQSTGQRLATVQGEISGRGVSCDALGAQAGSETGAAVTPSAAGATGTTARATGAVNMRAGPGTRHAVLGTLRAGDEVTVLGVDGTWCECMRPGQARFFVSCRYLSAPAGGWAAVGRGGGASGGSSGGAEQFLRDLYARLASDQQPSFDWKPLLAAETRGAWMRAYNADGSHEYDFDPLCSCQDPGGLRVTSVRIIAETEGRVLADVSFDFRLPSPPEAAIVRFLLVRGQGGWRILDVRYPQPEERLPLDSIRRRLGLSVASWDAPALGGVGVADISSPITFSVERSCSYSPSIDAFFDQMRSGVYPPDRSQLSQFRRPIRLAGMMITPVVREIGARNSDQYSIEAELNFNRPVRWNGLNLTRLFSRNSELGSRWGLAFAENPVQVQRVLAALGVVLDVPPQPSAEDRGRASGPNPAFAEGYIELSRARRGGGAEFACGESE